MSFNSPNMNLIADIGNSLTKAAIFSGGNILFETTSTQPDPFFFEKLISTYPVKKAIFSSVSTDSESFTKEINKKLEQIIITSSITPIPLINLYSTKETLGFDRLAAAVGAHTTFPDSNVLVIDAGTAITIDMVTAKGEFLGGNISPGLEMRFKALNTFTKKLPLVEKYGVTGLTGKTTEEAIRYGVWNGILFELDGYIEEYKKIFPSLKVILTGGDAKNFDKRLKNSIFVDSNLNLKGLNEILEYNAQ